MGGGRDDRSLSDLFAELARETSTLVRQEVQLAGSEMSQRASQLGKPIASLAIAGAIAYAGVLALVAGIILLLGEAGLPWWLAALLVGLALVGGGYFLVQRASATLKKADLVPHRTIETLREDGAWAKEQIR